MSNRPERISGDLRRAAAQSSSASFQTCCIADFQVGRAQETRSVEGLQSVERFGNPRSRCAGRLGSLRYNALDRRGAVILADGASAIAAEAAALPEINRRAFLKTTALASGLSVLGLEAGTVKQMPNSRLELIDVNVNLSRWPLRRLRGDDTSALVAMLRRRGVVQAWVGSFDGLLHKDIASVNARLADECRRHGRGLLLPFGSINPKLPDWEEELRRFVEEHHMPGIRLHPNYHGYNLDDPDFARLLRLAAARHLIVQLAVVMEDERMMHPLLRVEPVDTGPLVNLVKQTPGLRLVLLNALRTVRDRPLADLLAAGQVYVEISMLEGVGGLANLLAQVPMSRVLFGSHAPLFYFESALLKLKESALSEEQLRAVRSGNAQRMVAKSRS